MCSLTKKKLLMCSVYTSCIESLYIMCKRSIFCVSLYIVVFYSNLLIISCQPIGEQSVSAKGDTKNLRERSELTERRRQEEVRWRKDSRRKRRRKGKGAKTRKGNGEWRSQYRTSALTRRTWSRTKKTTEKKFPIKKTCKKKRDITLKLVILYYI